MPLALALMTDITERKHAEERLRDAQKLESLGLLAGGVAHDFNNLLVGVIGNASLAQEMLPPDHAAIELLEGVTKAGEQAAHLTRQMLAYSGKGKFLVEALNLSALIPEMTGLVRPSISKKISLHLDLAERSAAYRSRSRPGAAGVHEPGAERGGSHRQPRRPDLDPDRRPGSGRLVSSAPPGGGGAAAGEVRFPGGARYRLRHGRRRPGPRYSIRSSRPSSRGEGWGWQPWPASCEVTRAPSG